MPGRGRTPKPPESRRSRHVPRLGEWTAAPGVGWQHGPTPDPPAGLADASIATWQVWFGAWFASHWTPGDLPGLGIVIRLYDETVRGKLTRAGELRMWADSFGITPAGAQARRWLANATPASSAPQPAGSDPYARLRVVGPDIAS